MSATFRLVKLGWVLLWQTCSVLSCLVRSWQVGFSPVMFCLVMAALSCHVMASCVEFCRVLPSCVRSCWVWSSLGSLVTLSIVRSRWVLFCQIQLRLVQSSFVMAAEFCWVRFCYVEFGCVRSWQAGLVWLGRVELGCVALCYVRLWFLNFK